MNEPAPPAIDPARELLRHAVATVAYRAAKPLRDAPSTFADFEAAPGSRTPRQILGHMGDLFDWAVELARGSSKWTDAPLQPWDAEVARFFATLERFDALLASAEPLQTTPEKLLQGPVADALQHTGQLTYLRRLAGAPIRGESYFRATITAGRLGLDQAPPGREFD